MQYSMWYICILKAVWTIEITEQELSRPQECSNYWSDQIIAWHLFSISTACPFLPCHEYLKYLNYFSRSYQILIICKFSYQNIIWTDNAKWRTSLLSFSLALIIKLVVSFVHLGSTSWIWRQGTVNYK